LGNLTIGAFAKSAEVNIETIRFYQRKGLLVEPDRPYGGIRRYGEADVARVKFVKVSIGVQSGPPIGAQKGPR
jgi:MerR family mercuric resistance operon transcriptional regulator